MANELVVSGGMAFTKSGVTYPAGGTPVSIGESWTNILNTITGEAYVKRNQLIGFAAPEALDLGDIDQPHWAQFLNLDPTNFIKIQNGVDGDPFMRLYPGELSPAIPLDLDCVPYAIADTAACWLYYFILQR